MGVDPDNGWDANWQIIPEKEKVLKALKKAAKKFGFLAKIAFKNDTPAPPPGGVRSLMYVQFSIFYQKLFRKTRFLKKSCFNDY